eukprot:359944-Chlamydomonas_euryale.AAC.2
MRNALVGAPQRVATCQPSSHPLTFLHLVPPSLRNWEQIGSRPCASARRDDTPTQKPGCSVGQRVMCLRVRGRGAVPAGTGDRRREPGAVDSHGLLHERADAGLPSN